MVCKPKSDQDSCTGARKLCTGTRIPSVGRIRNFDFPVGIPDASASTAEMLIVTRVTWSVDDKQKSRYAHHRRRGENTRACRGRPAPSRPFGRALLALATRHTCASADAHAHNERTTSTRDSGSSSSVTCMPPQVTAGAAHKIEEQGN
eukprot:COSAG02_NODE_182_length_30594_cov_23.562912_19_plen_148_part_00